MFLKGGMVSVGFQKIFIIIIIIIFWCKFPRNMGSFGVKFYVEILKKGGVGCEL